MTRHSYPAKGTKTDLPKRLAFGLTMLLHGEHMSRSVSAWWGNPAIEPAGSTSA